MHSQKSFLFRELTNPLRWMLLAIPAAFILRHYGAPDQWTFFVSAFAIIPLSERIGRATESLAEELGPTLGGLLNATFGNAAELIIAMMSLFQGPQMYPLVKASLTGSIISNLLLVLGLALTFGGLKHTRLDFNQLGASIGSTLMLLAVSGVLLPSIYHLLATDAKNTNETVATLSEEIAIILAVTYILSMVFSLVTHKHLFEGPTEKDDEEIGEPKLSRGKAIALLVAGTIAVTLVSDVLVDSANGACAALGMSQVFVGVIVVAVIGNASENYAAILFALKNKAELSVGIAVGSSIQIALFVAPVLVITSMFTGHGQTLDLHFTPLEIVAVILSIFISTQVCRDGRGHWIEGVMLLALYLMLGLAFFYMPANL